MVLTLGVLLVMPTRAVAGPTYTLLNTASAVTAGGTYNDTTGLLVNEAARSVFVSSSGFGESATASASAAPGKLGALAMVSSNSSSFGGATASATAAFTDMLTILGSGDVTLGFTLGVTGLLDGCDVCGAQANV